MQKLQDTPCLMQYHSATKNEAKFISHFAIKHIAWRNLVYATK